VIQALEILPEGFIDDLGVGEAVEVGLSADRLNPALFDVEGDALGLTAGIASLLQSDFAAVPPDDDLLQRRYQTDNHVIVGRRWTLGGHVWRRGSIDTFLSGGRYGSSSVAQVSNSHKYTICVH